MNKTNLLINQSLWDHLAFKTLHLRLNCITNACCMISLKKHVLCVHNLFVIFVRSQLRVPTPPLKMKMWKVVKTVWFTDLQISATLVMLVSPHDFQSDWSLPSVFFYILLCYAVNSRLTTPAPIWLLTLAKWKLFCSFVVFSSNCIHVLLG